MNFRPHLGYGASMHLFFIGIQFSFDGRLERVGGGDLAWSGHVEVGGGDLAWSGHVELGMATGMKYQRTRGYQTR